MKIFKVQQLNEEGKVVNENVAMLTDNMVTETLKLNGDKINIIPLTHGLMAQGAKEVMLLPIKFIGMEVLPKMKMDYIYSAAVMKFDPNTRQQRATTELVSEEFIIDAMTTKEVLFKQIILLDPQECIVTYKENVVELINSCGTIQDGQFTIPGCDVKLDAQGKSLKDLTEEFIITLQSAYDSEIDEVMEKMRQAEQAEADANPEKEVAVSE